MNRRIVVLDAPSNLGLRPPQAGVVPGAYKLAGALRDQGLVARLGAQDGGVVTPPRYLPDWDGQTVRNAAAIVSYSVRLADRVQAVRARGGFPLVLGGDCSILLGTMLALRRTGRFGLAFVDGHLDFRHPGNSAAVGSAAGEDLALVTGRGAAHLTNMEALSPFVRDEDVVTMGFRPGDEYAAEVAAAGITTIDAVGLRQSGAEQAGRTAVAALERRDVVGYWVHLDADVLDAALMPAVDTPEADGLTFEELTQLLRVLLGSPLASGLEVTVFDPDLDPDGHLAGTLADVIVDSFVASAATH
jgi:arginase